LTLIGLHASDIALKIETLQVQLIFCCLPGPFIKY